jgi:DNA-3-methyladenine glycosylase
LVELLRQIRELVNDDFRVSRRDAIDHGLPVEDLEHDGIDACTRKPRCFFGRTRRAGDRMTGAHEKRDKTATDGAGSAGQKYTHGGIANALLRRRREDLSFMPLGRRFFARSVHVVAPELIGATLLVDGVGGTIVEVEAYHHTDPAAHSYRGRTERNAVMFGPPGYAYIYRSYGIHWCLNFVCEREGSASAVLIRAIEPIYGIAAMRRRRKLAEARLLCSGPGRVCQALGITRAHNGLALNQPPFELRASKAEFEIAIGPRIGITKAADVPWRYGQKGSRFLSRAFK